MPAGPEAKESPGFFDLMAFSSEVLIFFALWFSADSRTQKLNSDKFGQWRIRRRMWRNMYQKQIVLTQSYDAKFWPAASYLDAGRRIKDRGRPVDISWQKAKSTRNCGARLRLAPINTREMQGIVGQASDFVEVVSKIDWTLLHEIWWREMEKIKGDWRATLWYGFFAWIHQPTHEFDCRTSSGCRCLWGTHVGGHARTRYRVGPGLRLPMRKKENVEETLQPLAASTELECERQA